MATGIPELDAVLRALNKQYKKDMVSKSFGDKNGLTTGSSRLDWATGWGGIPEGALTEIYGWEGSGKTSLALTTMAKRQQHRRDNNITNKRDLLIDLEYSITEKFLKGFGIDLDQLIWIRPDTVEEALGALVEFTKSGSIDFVIYDSIDAGQNERQLKRQVGETDVGSISKEMSFALRQLSKLAPKTGTTIVFINQIRQNPGAGMYQNPNVTPGGNATKFYCMLRLELMSREKCTTAPNTFIMRVKIKKTKAHPVTDDPVKFEFQFGRGVDSEADLYDWAKSIGVLKMRGAYAETLFTGDTEVTRIGGAGRHTAIAALKESPELRTKLHDLCSSVASLEPGAEVEADDV